ncbi:hypothetical protein FSARC_11220 [Fusarium sarcochroum]|uniref:Uncharacterized protein n=1 Tax=Fusarium sarcochroum TaxID=1208366 RepID=A0A8H4X1K6_9HYPO|nr:hypothetical protein FSARC_11220 [Fusarium sarcochroum]
MNVQTARQGHAPSLMDLAKAGMLYFPENEEILRRLKVKKKRDARKAKKRRARRRERKLERSVEHFRQYLRDQEIDLTLVTNEILPSLSHSTDNTDSCSDSSPERPRSEPHDIPFLEFFPELAPFWQNNTAQDTPEAMTTGTNYDVEIVAPEHDGSFVHWLGETACQSFGNDEFWEDFKNPAFGMTEKTRRNSLEDIRFWQKPPSQKDVVLEACSEFAALWQDVPHEEPLVTSIADSKVAMESSFTEAPTIQGAPNELSLSKNSPTTTSPTEDIYMPKHDTFVIQDDLTLIFGSDNYAQLWEEPCRLLDQYVESQPAYCDHSSFDATENSDQSGTDAMLAWLMQEAGEEQKAKK